MRLFSRRHKRTPDKKGKSSEGGQAIIVIVFAIIGLIGMTALAVDGGNAYLEKRNTQNAADAIALDAALARIKNPQGADWVYSAFETAERHGYSREDIENRVQIHSPPVTGDYTDNVEYIQVVVSSEIDTYFAGIVGINHINIRSEATSRTKPSELIQILDGNALISLAPTSECEKEKERAFWVAGESTLGIYGGGVFINSNNPSCALMQSGSGSIRVETGWGINVVGGADIKKPKLLTPSPPQTNSPPVNYPPPFLMPKIGCGKAAEVSLIDPSTMSSGAWTGDFPPPGVKYLEAGIYCIEGDFIVSNDAPLEGSNIVIKVENGRVRFDGHPTVNLHAPQSGEFAGLLLYVPMENSTEVTLNLGVDSEFKGTVLAPSSQVRINTDYSEFGFHSQIITYTFRSNGQSIIKIKYNDEENFDAFTMPIIQLVK